VVRARAAAGELVVPLERVFSLAVGADHVRERALALEQLRVVELAVAVEVAARLLERAVAMRGDAVDDVAEVVGGRTSDGAGGAADLFAEFGRTAALSVGIAVGAQHACRAASVGAAALPAAAVLRGERAGGALRARRAGIGAGDGGGGVPVEEQR